jgi:hypothetical protein
MTETKEVTITINSIAYYVKALNVKRSLKNTLIKVAKPVSKSNQNGTNSAQTLGVDLKKIVDMLTITGEIRGQTLTTFKNSITVFNEMADAFKKQPGPYTIVYRGVTYSGLLDQLESEDKSDILQSYQVENGTRIESVPAKVNVTISFTICTVR